MTCKEIRAQQLEDLKQDGLDSVEYHVSMLDGSFLPYKTFTFETKADALHKYDELLREGVRPGFLRRWISTTF